MYIYTYLIHIQDVLSIVQLVHKSIKFDVIFTVITAY